MKKRTILQVIGICFFWLASFSISTAQDLVVLGGTYDQAEYPGYKKQGVYTIQISKTDSYTFTAGQFEINVSLPPQGVYDPTRASEVILPIGWEMIVAPNDNGSFILRLTQGSVYAGAGPGINRRRDFFIPIITSAGAVDQPTLVTVQWNDFEVTENPQGNSGGSVLNVLNVPLPVTLTSFTAQKESTTTFLNWSTTSETNSDRFEVQRSQNGKNWEKIGTVASNGESTALRNYSFTDPKPVTGENLYRLRMVDKDETFAYSRIRSITFGEVSDLSVYPNPSSDFINIRDYADVKEISILDLKGNTVYQSDTLQTGEVDVRDLLPGIYSVQISRINGVQSAQKIVVLN